MRKGVTYDLLMFLLKVKFIVEEDILNSRKELFHLLMTKWVEKQQTR